MRSHVTVIRPLPQMQTYMLHFADLSKLSFDKVSQLIFKTVSSPPPPPSPRSPSRSPVSSQLFPMSHSSLLRHPVNPTPASLPAFPLRLRSCLMRRHFACRLKCSFLWFPVMRDKLAGVNITLLVSKKRNGGLGRKLKGMEMMVGFVLQRCCGGGESGEDGLTFAAAATYAAWPWIMEGFDPVLESSSDDIFLFGLWEL